MILFKNKETLSGVLFLLLSAYLFYEIQQFSVAVETIRSLGPDFFPNILAVVMGLLSIMLIIQGILGKPAPLISESLRNANYLPPLAILFGAVTFIFFLPILGFVVWNILFLGSTQFIMGERRPLAGILFTLGVTALVYVVFCVFLQVPLEQGGFLGL